MNRRIGMIASCITLITVIMFAIFMILNMSSAAYSVCIILSVGYITMAASFSCYAKKGSEAAKYSGMAFAIIYGVFVMLVYYAQITTLIQDGLDEQVVFLLDYKKFGLFFAYDLFGYGMLAISTFFIGLTINSNNRPSKMLRVLMLIHGVFSVVCIIPVLNLFDANMPAGDLIGIAVLEVWCLYFIPICILSYKYFKSQVT